MTRQHDVFLSYSRKDSATMRRVRDSMISAGLTVWTDEGIEPGTESWKQSIQQAIEYCGAMVVLLSPDAKQSIWVNREIGYAQNHEKRIFPLLVLGTRRTAIPIDLAVSQYVDIRREYIPVEDDLIPALLKYLNIVSRERLEHELQKAEDEIERLKLQNKELVSILGDFKKNVSEIAELRAKLEVATQHRRVTVEEVNRLQEENSKLKRKNEMILNRLKIIEYNI